MPSSRTVRVLELCPCQALEAPTHTWCAIVFGLEAVISRLVGLSGVSQDTILNKCAAGLKGSMVLQNTQVENHYLAGQ